MKLIVGLGNPGSKYARTRHNVGWMVLDRLADRAGMAGRGRERDAAVTIRGRLHDIDLMLVKPLTFMNDSGIAVRKVLSRERVPLEEMLVVVDDFALPFGRLRIRADGTHGGHNGLRSIVAELETQHFARLRVGIGEPGRDAIDHVLSSFTRDEERELPALLDAAADAVETWARDGAARAANLWNGWTLEGAATAAAGAAPARRTGVAAPAAADDAAPAADAGPGPGEVGGPPGPDGIRRTTSGWRRVLPRDPGARSRADGP